MPLVVVRHVTGSATMLQRVHILLGSWFCLGTDSFLSSFIWNRIKATEESYQGFSLKTSTSCRDLEKIFHRCLWDVAPSNHETLWKKHTSCNKRQNHSIYDFIYLLVHADTSWDGVESCEWGALPAGHHRRPEDCSFAALTVLKSRISQHERNPFLFPVR